MTRFPWSGALPTVRTYAVAGSHDPDGSFVYEVLDAGRGAPMTSTASAEEATAAAAALVPDGLGRAVLGSVDDL